MRSGYTILEHPADLGIEARGRTFAEALVHAAEGLMSIIVDPSSVRCTTTRKVHITSSDREQLVVKWLSEILFLYDGEKFVANKFIIDEVTGTSLRAAIEGEYFDQGVHSTRLDVKAITYHQLKVVDHGDGCSVRVYLDI